MRQTRFAFHLPVFAASFAAASFLSIPLIEAAPPKGEATAKGTVARRYDSGSTRYLHANRGFARSGPGDTHYPTSVLPQGSSVEVYIETTDGWSAVKPLANSHNWIPAKSAFLLPGGKSAEITQEDVPAWVGTVLEQPKTLRWQTSLVKGQVVQVLGEQTQQSADGSKELWYRIAPPQGEFRWLRTNLLSSQMPVSLDNSVQQAAYGQAIVSDATEVQVAGVGGGIDGEVDGEVVWSDEANALAEVNRQIRAEQGKLDQGLPHGARFGDEYVDDEGFEGAFVGSVEEAMSTEELSRAKRHRNAQHQVDSLRHWDSLEVSNPQLKLKPLASVLGLIGFGVVEADKAPVSAGSPSSQLPIQSQIAQERNAFPNGSMDHGQTLAHLNAPTGSRLDRLPRPGRSAKITSPQSGRDPLAGIGHGANPIDPNKPVLTRLWNSDQPLFGPSGGPSELSGPSGVPVGGPLGYGAALAHSGAASGQYQWYALNQGGGSAPLSIGPSLAPSMSYLGNGTAPIPQSLPQPGESHLPIDQWHADQNASTQLTSQRMNDAFADPLAETEFQTPEIQLAMLDLTRIVSQPTENWNLHHLRDQCQRWIDQGGSSIVRGEARLLLERVDRFDDLRTRTLGSFADPSRLAMGNRANESEQQPTVVQFASSSQFVSQGGDGGAVPASVSQASAHGIPGYAEASARSGDASGWLVQVHGSLPGQPEFALTDDQGKVVTYVQTTAALNIRRYLQQPVIIYGQRGYIPNLAARQITVERIARLR